ncbi:MAG: amino acid ABC transporter permease [Actinomycetota bacterium]|nr:amino acid ABC transporter permease [Actinomycetota bacterium]
MSSVLYDVAGPKAIARNRILGVVTVLAVGALFGFVIYRLILTGQFSSDKWEVFSYGAVWKQIAEATGRTLAAFATAAVLSVLTGLVLGIARLSDHRWVRWPATAVVELLRAIPVLILMMLLYYGFPELGVHVPSYWAVVIALTAYNGSVLAEVLRTGVDSVPRGQSEAGYAIGLRKTGVMRLVLLPQAIRAMLPVIVAQLVVTLKDTALGYIITYNELLYYARLVGTQAQYDSPILQAGMVAAVIYIALCLALAGFAKWVEGRARRSPRTRTAAAPAEIIDEGA